MARRNYDYVIIGGGLSGCLIARALSNLSTFHIAILEGGNIWGGHVHPQNSPFGMLSYGMKIIPSLPKTDEALKFFEFTSGTTLERDVVSLPPLVLEKGALQPFYGFGDKAPKEVDELGYYLNPERVKLSVPVQDWIELLKKDFIGDMLNKSQVTQFELDQNRVKAVIVNGNQRIEADNFIFCGYPPDILQLLPTASMDSRSVQKIAKSKWWTSVSLDLIHKTPPTDIENIHVITGGSEMFCTLGYFHKIPEGPVVSQWLSLIPTDSADEEAEATALREMKRLIKRAYPKAFDDILHERILVNANSHGSIHLKMTEKMTLPGFDNLWLSSGMINEEKNILGALLQAKEVFTAIKALRAIQAEKSPPHPQVWS
jgi:hypothetical protein